MEKLLEARNKVLLSSEKVNGAEDKEMRHLVREGVECSEHSGFLLEYWCYEDMMDVCQECLIFGKHKGHDAARSKKR